MKVVLDTNVFIAALFTKSEQSPSLKILRMAIARKITGYTSSIQLSELVDVLSREKYRKKISLEKALKYTDYIRSSLRSVRGDYQDISLVPTDAKDDPIVSIGLESQAKYIITDDGKDLGSLKVIRVSGHRPLQIISPDDFFVLEGGD